MAHTCIRSQQHTLTHTNTLSHTYTHPSTHTSTSTLHLQASMFTSSNYCLFSNNQRVEIFTTELFIVQSSISFGPSYCRHGRHLLRRKCVASMQDHIALSLWSKDSKSDLNFKLDKTSFKVAFNRCLTDLAERFFISAIYMSNPGLSVFTQDNSY